MSSDPSTLVDDLREQLLQASLDESQFEAAQTSDVNVPTPPTKDSTQSPPRDVREGYGFRTNSGFSTPITGTKPATEDVTLPDQHGLGWPGMT
jgi:hypothetical protein